MTVARELTGALTDEELWRLVRKGSVAAFETVVGRHQAAVSAMAYCACGDLALSEDIAQETFWAAWRDREAIERPDRLGAWLCGIARNLGKNAGRKAARAADSAAARSLDTTAEPRAEVPGPAERAASREEQAIVWKTLEQIPEAYREPLILFYREERSVAEVARALDLSEDAVKQRLARGRGMIRDRIAARVEETLRRSKPGRAFTLAVVAGLTAQAAGAQAAVAGVGIGAGAGAGAAKAAGIAGGAILGPILGLLGGWFGAWAPAELAHTRREREYLRRQARTLTVASVIFTAVMAMAPLALWGGWRPAYWYIWGASMLGFLACVGVISLRTMRDMGRLRAEASPDDAPNDSPVRARVVAITSRYRGRAYRSRATFLGLPLIDINVSDPSTTSPPGNPTRQRARGWIAIGDEARGLVLAIATETAVGFIAFGGRSLGVISLGGAAVGLVACGGLALGLVSCGGLALGGLAFGGGAMGYWAIGGGAVGWDIALGGGAFAWHAAMGGGAFAREFALGGGGWATHFNDRAARDVVINHPLKPAFDWYLAHVGAFNVALVAFMLALTFLRMKFMFLKGDGAGGSEARWREES